MLNSSAFPSVQQWLRLRDYSHSSIHNYCFVFLSKNSHAIHINFHWSIFFVINVHMSDNLFCGMYHHESLKTFCVFKAYQDSPVHANV